MAPVPTVGGGRANLRVLMNCGPEEPPPARLPHHRRTGPSAPTADPFDRAHNVHGGAFLLVSGDLCSGGPARNLVARPRRYHPSNMPVTLVDRGRVAGRASVDSEADGLAERLDEIAIVFGIDLLRGKRTLTPAWVRARAAEEVGLRDLLECRRFRVRSAGAGHRERERKERALERQASEMLESEKNRAAWETILKASGARGRPVCLQQDKDRLKCAS